MFREWKTIIYINNSPYMKYNDMKTFLNLKFLIIIVLYNLLILYLIIVSPCIAFGRGPFQFHVFVQSGGWLWHDYINLDHGISSFSQ